jgi:hypothetical protein
MQGGIMKISNMKNIKHSLLVVGLLLGGNTAWARDVEYGGKEIPLYVTPGEPTQITFPGEIKGGFKRKNTSLALEKQNNFLVVFAQPSIPYEGEALLIHMNDNRSFALRVLPANDENGRDEFIQIKDLREESYEEDDDKQPSNSPRLQGFAPPSTVPGLIREMILVAEFGKRKPIQGYRRSNRYTGETVLHDGTVEVKIDEIFMGNQYWGYVLNVENLLDAGQKINPASFRLDGTRAVTAQRWELSGRPSTAEQDIAGGHKAKIYVVTKALKR